ncbi:MAG: cyclodeaminase/cyclohydrolase family protein [Dysgonamonadaceae bacterium]|jgi:formiminotetrahydrofolate cyclodeaminase|nr:cyclodeaminase/cyclohydrolase family protein [Dysgonamonadaceae bacterium]MDD4247218.1 cyclodeaminase/cyclohydrolase family protein [Dysgonamonadaceae bacterium]MDD4606124.1 cyclodeaminase/cyclohydrolase family protein [Dysgonamonadaceae bacterium]HUI32050.1 cyclodeaminase/cyclohydrolase family protein [Dysgonamonadaceae bacterium]
MNSKDQSIQDFLTKTASNTPVPGGGSISALNGAIATALAEMLANLTIGKKKYADVQTMMEETTQEMNFQRTRFLEEIDRDAEAYNLVFEAYKLPKETEEQNVTRTNQIEHATKQAALIPMEIAQRAFNLMDAIANTTRNGNRNAVTDGCIAMMTCRTAVLGALLNVRINLGSIKDSEFVNRLTDKCNATEEETIRKERELIDWVKTTL